MYITIYKETVVPRRYHFLSATSASIILEEMFNLCDWFVPQGLPVMKWMVSNFLLLRFMTDTSWT